MENFIVRRLFVAGVAVLAGVAVATAATRQNIEYGQADGEHLLLDVNMPASPGPFPVAILVHGGGWGSGDKAGRNKPGDSADISPWFAPLTAANFTWFSINYRLAPAHRWPACFEDTLTAIRWVKAHATEYNGDPRRIVLFGHSAGGQLVCLAATQADDDVRVQAVVGFAPVTDFEQDLAARGGLSTALQNLHDRPKDVTPEALALLRETSPINHVHTGLPPFLILQGAADRTVPLQQSLNFQAKLKANSVRCDLIILPGAPHRLVDWDKFDATYATRTVAWLQQALAAPKPLEGAR